MKIVAAELVFRKMTVEDIDAIGLIEQDSFSTPWTAEAFYNELTNNMFAQYMVMEYRKQVIGYAGMWIIIDEAHITNIAILTDYRGLGLGTRLMTEVQKTAIYLGAKRMTLEVRVSNDRAQHLYSKFGFVREGVRPAYYADNGEDALIMWANLEESNQHGLERA